MSVDSQPIISTNAAQCYHCGEDCNQQKLEFNHHIFCCNGCKTVYEILNHSELESYYSIENNPGLKPIDPVGAYEFLELPEVKSKLIQYADESILKMKLHIPQIHCSSCIYLLEQLHKIDADILSARVNFQQRDIVITVKQSPDALKDVFKLLNRIGYSAQIPDSSKKTASKTKSLLIKIGVAGFCFGNIMLLSFPEYVSGASTINATYTAIFKYLILALTLPVLFYAASDYYVAAFKSLRQKHLSVDIPVVLGIFALTIRSLYEIFVLHAPGYFDSLSGFIFFLLIGKWFQSRTYDNLSFNKSYETFFPMAVLRKADENFETTSIAQLEVGDIIKLRNREVLPLDAKLLSNEADFDYSFVTGESKTIHRKQSANLFAGGQLKSATALFEITKAYDNDYLKSLWAEKAKAETSSKNIHSLIDLVSHKFTITIILIAIAGGVFWFFNSGFSKALEIFSAILIVACPCALALAAPFTYSNASRLLGKAQIFLQNTSIVERLSKIKSLVFDKTGTLTKQNHKASDFNGAPLSNNDEVAIQAILACSLHPLSQSLAEQLAKNESLVVEGFEEFVGKGLSALVQDNHYLIGSRTFLASKGVEEIPTNNIGNSHVCVAKDHQFIGYFSLHNQYRPHLLKTINSMSANYNIKVLSGDGDFELDYLNHQFNGNVGLHFNQKPEDKLSFIQHEKEHAAVMMLGDGINDALALKAADVGVAVTEDFYSFTPNSDIIISADALNKIPSVLQYAHRCHQTLLVCLVVSLLYNIIGLGFAFSGSLSPLVAAILMPISSVTVVAIAVLLTNYFAHKSNLLK